MQKLCRFYPKCKKEDKCIYLHSLTPICVFFKQGKCIRDPCNFLHPSSKVDKIPICPGSKASQTSRYPVFPGPQASEINPFPIFHPKSIGNHPESIKYSETVSFFYKRNHFLYSFNEIELTLHHQFMLYNLCMFITFHRD